MSSLRLDNSLPSPASTSLKAAGSVVAEGDYSDASSRFSLLLDHFRGSAGGQGLSTALLHIAMQPRSGSGGSFLEPRHSEKSLSGARTDAHRNNPISSSSQQDTSKPASASQRGADVSKASRCRNDGDQASPSSTRQSSRSGSPSPSNANESATFSNAAPSASAVSASEDHTEAAAGDAGVEALREGSVSRPAQEMINELQALVSQIQQRLDTMSEARRDGGPETDTDSDERALLDDLLRLASSLDEKSGLDLLRLEGALPDRSSPMSLLGRKIAADLQSDAGGPEALSGSSQNHTAQTGFTEVDRAQLPDAASAAQPGHQFSMDVTSVVGGLKAALGTARHQAAQSGLAQPDVAALPEASSLILEKEPSGDRMGKPLSPAEQVIAQLANLSQAVSDPSQPQGKSASTPVFGSADHLRALFSATGAGGSDGGSLDSGGYGQQGGGAGGGGIANGAAGNAALAAGAEGAKGSNPYSFASHLSSLRSANTGMTTLFSPAEQVIVHLHRTLANGDNRLSIQLNPLELGRIDIKLDMTSDGRVQGTVVASNPSTLDMLLKDSRGLERALQEAGLQADSGSLRFSLGGQQQDGASGQTSQNGRFGSSHSAQNTSSSSQASQNLSADSSLETWVISPNRVNVRI